MPLVGPLYEEDVASPLDLHPGIYKVFFQLPFLATIEPRCHFPFDSTRDEETSRASLPLTISHPQVTAP